MAESDDRNIAEELSAASDPRLSTAAGKPGKKKKKRRGCGFFILLTLLAAGAAAGLQASGGVDLRPYVYPVVPKIPYVGSQLSSLLSIPEIYAMTTQDRRRIELDEWESLIAESARSLDMRELALDSLSNDLSEMERSLGEQREELASRLEALSGDEPGNASGTGEGSGDTGIEETIRTFQDMSPRNAAAILEKLDADLAVAILDGLPQDTRGTLLGRMDAEIAANLTRQLTELQKGRQRRR
ncbi:MAG: MgtE intracellular region [Synergistaceae bacterium]|jgi:flagellar motility protein MotE (MotC chaperone)|nr:MgtE intracellular region [Synergistaceae bacterium]